MTPGPGMLEERHDQAYLRRPSNLAVRRHRRRRGALRWALLLVVQLALVGAVVVIGRQAYLAVVTSSRFEVKTLVFHGNQRSATTELIGLVHGVVGRNIFRVDLDAMRATLRRSPWILEASVRRSLPSTLEIDVTEREPAAMVSYEGRVWIIDATGRRLAEYGPELARFDFPILTGIEGLPRPQASERIRRGAAAIAALGAATPSLSRRISEIDLASSDRLTLRLADGSPPLYLDPTDPVRNLGAYAEVQKLLRRQGPEGPSGEPAKIEHIDLRFQGRIAVMTDADAGVMRP